MREALRTRITASRPPQADVGGGRRYWIAVGALLCVSQAAAAVAIQLEWPRLHIILLLSGALPYAVAVWLALSGRGAGTLPIIMVVALLLRLGVLFLEPFHSTDIYRYVWEGRIQAAGFSPYLHVPADEALAALRDEAIWPNVNRADYAPSIYPPGAQMLFLAATRVSESIVWMKTVSVLFEGVAAWAVLKLLDFEGGQRARLAIYAWCPLPVWEFANAGHVDAAMMAFAVLALLAARMNRPGWSGAALAAAVLVKFLPLAIAPALMPRRGWRFPLAMAGAIAAAYLVYAAGSGARVLGFLSAYAGEEGISDGSGLWMLSVLNRLGFGLRAGAFIPAAGLALLALGLSVWWRGTRSAAGDALLLGAALMLVLSPQYPWYLLWLLPFACLAPVAADALARGNGAAALLGRLPRRALDR